MNLANEKTDQLDNLLGLVVDEYLERRAGGENPGIEEYAKRHPELADVIRVSLRALELAGGSLSSGGAVSTNAGLQREQTLGDFRILDELGRGGMGVVYEAEQISMGRRVALKVLPFAAMVNEQALRRFRNEVRAAALLDHPNIVSVYFVGEDRGVHHYAMQLIRGQTLADVIAELVGLQNTADPLNGDSINHVLSASDLDVEEPPIISALTEDRDVNSVSAPANSTTSPEIQAAISTLATAPHRGFYHSAARLGIQAARALQHAHDLGVLHRDIKPGNMMLDAHSQLQITDFGLARIATDAGVTMSGDLIGTLRYMAPEQALGKRVVVDHRADIYSLGVTLYELLTLQPAFDQPNRPALLKQIAFDDPPPPRRIERAIPPELETIVLKAMSKNPDERYESSEQLAEDLESFLEHRPIKAKPPTVTQVAAKWCRRHQTVTWSAGLLVILLAVGSSIASLLIWQEKERTSSALVLAESHLNIARQAIESLLVDMAEELDDTPTATKVQRKLLDTALGFYENFPEEASGRPEVRADVALAFQRAGEIHWKFGRSADRRKAAELYSRSAAIYRKLADEFPTKDAYQLGLAKSYRLQARGFDRNKQSETRRQLFQQSVQLLITLLAKNPDNAVFQHELAVSLVQRYGTFTASADSSLDEISRAVAVMRNLVKRFPDNHQFAHALSSALAEHAVVLEKGSEYQLAEAARREALSIVQQLSEAEPDSRRHREELAGQSAFLGAFLRDRGRHEESDEAFQEAIETQDALIRDYPNVANFRTFALSALGNYRDSLLQRGKLSEARQTWERYLELQEAELDYHDHPREVQRFRVRNLDSYGTILHELGELQLARNAWQESLTLAQRFAAENLDSIDDQGWFAWISATCPFPKMRDTNEAALAAAKAVELNTDDGGDELVVHGWCEYRLARWQGALKLFDLANGRRHTSLHEADRVLGLAATKWQMGQRDEAVQHYERGKQLAEQDQRSGTAPYVTRRLSAEVGQLLELQASESRE